MSSIHTLLLIVQIIAALTIICLVLMQHGKGADMGSSFGSGSAGSLFGASGAANFLSRTTKWAAVVFFAATTGLAYFTYQPATAQRQSGGVMEGYQDRSVPQLGDVPAGTPGGASAVPSIPGADVPAQQSAVPAEPQPAPVVPAAPEQQAPVVNEPAPATTESPAVTEEAPAATQPAVPDEQPAAEQPAATPSAEPATTPAQ